MISAACRANCALRVAPSGMFPPNTVAGEPIRSTSPSSWSVLMTIGTRGDWLSAVRWMPLDSDAIWAGALRLPAQVK